MTGSVVEGKTPVITEIDGYDVNVATEGKMLIAYNVDRPGIIGRVGTLLGEYGVNIAFMQVGRKEVGFVRRHGARHRHAPRRRRAREVTSAQRSQGCTFGRVALNHILEEGAGEMKRIRIFDTTLRDGEQSPGINLNTEEKMEIARHLAQLGVDIIEAGFPIASPGDFEAVHRIAKEVRGPVIAGLARAVEQDIVRAAEAVEPAEKPRIHTFIASSPNSHEAQAA